MEGNRICNYAGEAYLSLAKQIGMRAGIGKRKDKISIRRVEVEKHPVVLDMAVAKSVKVAGERMVSIFGLKRFAVGKFEDDVVDLVDVLAAPDHLLQAFAKLCRPEYPSRPMAHGGGPGIRYSDHGG